MHIHILGICGTFMGSLAILARAQGHKVTGSDQNVYPPMSDLLTEQGIELIQGYDPAQLMPRPDMVVIGGEIVQAGDLMLVPVQQAINKYALARMRGHCELKMSNLGVYSAILGTMMMVMEHLYDDTECEYSLY